MTDLFRRSTGANVATIKMGPVMRLMSLCLCAAFGTAAQAETLQHGNIVYNLPQNWGAGAVEDGIQTLWNDAPDDVCEYCYIYLGNGEAKSGSLVEFAARRATDFVDEDDRDMVTVVQDPALSQLGSITIAMMGLKVDGDILIAFGYELSDRFEIVAFKGDGGYEGDRIEESTTAFQDQVLPMFASLQFVSEGAASLMPEPVRGGLSGVWWGSHQTTGIGLDGMMKIDVEQRRLVFWDDGYFYDGTPPTGLRPLDADALRAAADGSFGTYLEADGKVVLTFVTGEKEELEVVSDERLNDGNNDLYTVETVPDGTRLDGGVSSFFYSGFTPGSGVEGGVSSSSSTTFFPDGTYTGESFGGAFGNFVDGAGSMTGGFATGGDGNAEGGRYEIKDGLLIQYPNDGSPPTIALVTRTVEGLMLDDQFFQEN
jgi:hypothetical protein